MRSFLKLFFIAAVLFSLAPSSDPSADLGGWKNQGVTAGVKIFTKKLDNYDLVSVRGETIIDASPDTILGIMKENQIAHEWMPYVEEKRDIKMLGKSERLEFTKVNIPWPVTDRYFFNTGKISVLEDGSYFIEVESAKTKPFEVPGAILGHLHYSKFLIKPIEGGQRSFMTAEVNADPKGWLPHWLTDFAQQRWPVQFFGGIQEMVEKYGTQFNLPPGSIEEPTAVSH